VGWWVQFVAIGAGRTAADEASLLRSAQRGEWEFSRLPDDGWPDTSEVVERLAAKLDAPVIGGYVADSDAAACYFASPKGAAAMVAINPSYDDSDDAHTEQWTDPELHEAAVHALAAWAADYAPRKPSGDEIVERLSALEDEELSREVGVRSLVFAEDGMRVIFNDLLGIADLDEVVFAA
jgi:hypothetical protein